ncbi:unnamed protein product [Alopecurus aequalis]
MCGRLPVGTCLPTTWNYGAVEKALRESATRGEKCIFLPSQGQVFQSIEEAYEFFNMYSWEVGFGIRHGRSRINCSNIKTRQDIVCVCEGLDKKEGSRSSRCECPCMLSLLRADDDSWFVKRFTAEHSHPMSASCGEKRRWPSHSRIDTSTRELVRHLRSNNVQLSRVCSIVGTVHQTDSYVPFSRQSVRTMCAKLAQESIDGDMAKTIEVFLKIKKKDPGFVVAMDLDDKKRVRSLFFSHGSSRIDYASFGDVVTFDTTYRTNLYNLPFGLFVGVNHHFQSIIFGGGGGVLLTEETIEAFKWTFRNFVAAMGASAPQTILTDQCHQMRVAIEKELPDTRHRWCKWHVLKKAKESLGSVYSKNSAFKRDLHELIDQIVCPEEFETRWVELVTGYSLGENEFLARAFENREMWAKPYFTGTFCAGMTSTQRSESANHVLKTYIPRSAPMHLFVTQFDRLVGDRIADEGREEHATKQVNFLLRTGVPIERHATRIYTRAMFERFFRELFRSGALSCREGPEPNKFTLSYAQTSSSTDAARREYIVERNDERTFYSCVCKSFDHSGIPCRHILKVLVHTGAVEIPSSLIKKRWTVSAREAADVCVPEYADAAKLSADYASMHGLLHAAAMELVVMGTSSRQAFELAVNYISNAKAAISAMTVHEPVREVFDVQTAPADGGDVMQFDSSVAALPRVRSRGRPKELRFKSPIESPGSSKRPNPSSSSKAGKTGVDYPRRSTRFLKTGVYIINHCGSCGSTDHLTENCCVDDVPVAPAAKRRSCKSCGEFGHNRSTCGRKSTYVAK